MRREGRPRKVARALKIGHEIGLSGTSFREQPSGPRRYVQDVLACSRHLREQLRQPVGRRVVSNGEVGKATRVEVVPAITQDGVDSQVMQEIASHQEQGRFQAKRRNRDRDR
jgi:hypothetical protein